AEAPPAPAEEKQPEAAPEPVAAATEAREAQRANPAARRMASERAIDLSTVTGTGPGGRIPPQDVAGAPAAARSPAATNGAAEAQQPAAPAAPIARNGREERVRMSR